MNEFLTPTADAQAEFTEQRSRFIGHIFVVQSEQEAVSRIRAVREENHDARHNVFAYLTCDGAMRYSDDGEPQGTGGMPVLELLRHAGLQNVCCVVTRYFGGILLGTGGLARAYTHAAKLALDAAGISQMRVWVRIAIACPYAFYDRLQREISALEGICDSTQFAAQIDVQTLLPQHAAEQFLARITECSGGSVHGSVLAQEYRAFPVKKQE